MWRRFPFLLLAMAMLTGIDSARAQAPAKPARKPQVALQRRTFVAADVVFEAVEVDGVAGTEVTNERLERRLAWEIKRLDQIYALIPEQRKKLEVAGRGDFKRLFERIREKNETLRRVREDFMRSREHADGAKLVTVLKEVKALTQDLPEKSLVEGSIFVKTLKKTFSSEQRKKYEKDRLDFYRSRVEWAVTGGLEVLQLSDDQRRRLVTRIVEQTRPLRRYGQYDFQAVLIQASRLPESTLKPIFDDRQWRRLLAGFQEVKQLENEIIAGGYLPEEVDQPAGDSAHGIREEG